MQFTKQRVEALSDGVIAIIITIMVLNIPMPTVFDRAAMSVFLLNIFIYFISFFVVGVFWKQHHHLFSTIQHVSNRLITLNILYLFFLSLLPLFMKWVMLSPGKTIPVIGYASVYILTVTSYMLMVKHVLRHKVVLGGINKSEFKRVSNTFIWVRYYSVCFITLIAVVVTILIPATPSLLLLILPVLSSIANVYSEVYKNS